MQISYVIATLPSVIALPLEGQLFEKSVAGIISTPIVSVTKGITPQVSISREYKPVVVAPIPKAHPGDSTSCTIGQIEFNVKGQFNKTFPNMGIPVQLEIVLIDKSSMFTTNDVKDGLSIPHGNVGGVKLCK
jgi:hypothetical protein